MKQKIIFLVCYLFVVTVITAVYITGWLNGKNGQRTALVKEAQAAGRTEASPVKAIQDREVYYPGTEDLAPDEMRVIACGTGMPDQRRAQASEFMISHTQKRVMSTLRNG